ncbi:MAG: hypothetical protein ACLBM4_08285, partial [Dolichospermum sp.]
LRLTIMSYQNIKSDLLVELSTEEQQFLSGGRRPIICYRWRRYRYDKDKSEYGEKESESGDD